MSHLTFCTNSDNKPIEIYFFIDPLCPECWALEPYIKKLHIEYGQYFRLKHVLSGNLARLNITARKHHENIAEIWERTASRSGMSCDGSLWLENPIESPFIASIAIKAAELQGRKYGLKFQRILQEYVFLGKQNISDINILVEVATKAGLDVTEFKKDLHSESAAKAFQCDLKITSEMEVDEIPTLVFFNENIEDEGLKISGIYPYDIYVTILEEMLGKKLEPLPKPPLEMFLQHFKLVATKEISVVYDLSMAEAEREMKKWVLQNKVERIPAKYGTFWRYNGDKQNEY
ncbi:ClpXP adapter SpxH family protein [Aeribacillus pallidus]|uniref:ClpXP adapter SpxH family protein n=1 Tax=Aeribacillus pallidus TaxID=33936 RepID=UPI001D79380C|nr:DsbA family protein [Bacillus sp. (in: firmicutes)]